MPREWWEFVPLAANPFGLPKLPTEVWERILDECDVSYWYSDQNREKTFGACCLTCRAWLPRSRYHLYKRLKVRSKEQVKQVSKLLHSIPALRTRVEQLSVFGGNDGKRDASWIGLVGFRLGPKLKALTTIHVERVDFSLVKLEAYTFWGAFNQAWRPDATRKLDLWTCTATHLNQLIRLAFVTKAESLFLDSMQKKQAKSAPPVPVLPSGISLPLSRLYVQVSTSDIVLPILWHTLAKQCPSLSSVEIVCRDRQLDLSSPDGRQLLVSILFMFHRMQQHNDTTYLNLKLQDDILPRIEMKTRLCDKSVNTDNTLATLPRIRRKLVLNNLRDLRSQSSVESLVKVLALVEDAMVLTNYTNRRFHCIKVSNGQGLHDLEPISFQPLDDVLSRLHIAANDVHVIIQEGYGRTLPRNGCVLRWARERFPMLTAVVPGAFCDPEAGQFCRSHPKQEDGVKQEPVLEAIEKE